MLNCLKSLNSLCFYREILEDNIIKKFKELLIKLSRPDSSLKETQEMYFSLKSMVAETIITDKKVFAPTSWKNHLLTLVVNNSEFNNFFINNLNFPFEKTLINDIKHLEIIYDFNFETIFKRFDYMSDEDIFSKEIYNVESPLAEAFDKQDFNNLLECLKETLEQNKSGIFDQHKIFKANEEKTVVPIQSTINKRMEDLVGYESQKEKLLNNTRSFINGNGGLNTLLYGDMGTGKSTMILSLVDLYKDTPLRFIEVKKNELDLLPDIIEITGQYNYPFIIFIDDLSFDQGDDSYKILKNYLEGSLEKLPDNVLLYATSNKRTLVSQSKSEREDAVNSREILEEKLSLVSRFGLTIPFRAPNQDDYLKIVKSLAEKSNIEFSEEVKQEAIQWELRHMNRSGRTAEQFIKYLKSKQ